ncbi:MAG: hypothetical protein MUF49_20875 [Oculatellaceae cyanobacterium Prado106]|jgi:hypothetical protein|nr:hypothetical protein [Oculatellaceae cyanobacterium Prado106]
MMIHHISLAVNHPLHVAEVVAELWQGKAIPFPGHPGSFIAIALDAYGTAIEFLPRNTVLKPGLENEASVWFDNSNLDAAGYTASHVNIAVPISEAEIYAIADREGWRAVRCDRQGFFELIELWVENEVLIELLPPNLIERYLHIVQPENLMAALNLDLSSESTFLAS